MNISVLLFSLPLFLIVILLFIFWIRMIIDCLTNEPSEGNDKIIWVLVIIFLGLIGALIYALARRPKRIEKYGR